MDRLLLKTILASQKEELLHARSINLIQRTLDLSTFLSESEITVITGARRSGKSTLLESLFLQPKWKEQAIYINFEDPQLNSFVAEDFLTVYDEWQNEHSESAERLALFDEVQNVPGWEKWMNFFAKQKNFKVIVTGSNSNMLSAELGTHLTGRHRSLTLYPLSFKEIVNYQVQSKKLKFKPSGTLTREQKIKLRSLSEDYMKYGGFPRAWIGEDVSILAEYYQNIVERDVIRRKKIRSYHALEKFGLTVMNETGRKINKSKMAKAIGLKDADTVEKYLRYFSECYLGFEIRLFDQSVRKQLRNQSKFYAIDSALAKRVALPSDSRSGYDLENLVLVELLRRGCQVFYWQSESGIEIDFVAETPDRNRILVQVARSLSNPETLKRELAGFSEFTLAHNNLKIDEKIIITMDDSTASMPKNIKARTFYSWALLN